TGIGNIGHVLAGAGERPAPLGRTFGVRAIVNTVWATPWWLTRPSNPFVRKFDVRRSAGATASISAALILGWLLLAVALALRRGRLDLVAGATLTLALCGAVFSIADATPSTPPFLAETLGY